MRSVVLTALAAAVALSISACSTDPAEERTSQSASSSGSCVGACGGESPDGCWCDAECAVFGDCCSDKVPVCDGCPPVLCTLFCEHGFAKGPDGCEVCSCNPPPAGEQCGDTTCAAGEVCCNSSCGICTPPGGFCTQQVCGNECEDAGGVCRINSPSPCPAGTQPAALSCEILADVCCVPSNPPPLESSCQGHCGSHSGTCWCDDACEENGDCCPDKAAICDPEPCGNTTCAPGQSCQFCWGSLQCIPDGAQC